MGKVSLHALGVVESSVTNSSVGGADGKLAAVKLISRPVSVLGSLIDDLSGVNEKTASAS